MYEYDDDNFGSDDSIEMLIVGIVLVCLFYGTCQLLRAIFFPVKVLYRLVTK